MGQQRPFCDPCALALLRDAEPFPCALSVWGRYLTAPTYALPPYPLTIRASDDSGLFVDAVVNVTLVQGNDAPVIIPATHTVPESAGPGTFVGRPSWWDRENNTVTWRIRSGDDSGRFTIAAPAFIQLTQQVFLFF